MKLLLTLLLMLVVACGSSGKPVPTDPAEPVFAVALFSVNSATVSNDYFPLQPGTTWTYQVETEDGVETIVVEVLEATRTVDGVLCAIVRDRVFIEGLLIEDTHDWYAQDRDGNVWYMGEEVVNYEYDDDDNVIATDSDGAWQSGIDGAVAGIIMKVTLVPGDSYRQEYWEGEAEDMGEIVALDVLVTLADGTTHICLQTRDWNPLEPGADEFKYYAKGIGVVVEETIDGEERVELLGLFDVSEASLPDFDGATFGNPSNITNLYFPLPLDMTQTYALDPEEGEELVISTVLEATRMVNGIACRVVRVLEYEDGELVEETHDWYAQDDDGNVWYMGEDVVNYEYDDDGDLIGTDNDGAWEAGIDDAEAGIIMPANPTVGVSYYQEFYDEEAEDMAVLSATGVTVELADGRVFTNCLRFLEWTPLEPDALEYKYYAPGLGTIREENTGEGVKVDMLGLFRTSDGSLPNFAASTFSEPSTITHPLLAYTPGLMTEFEAETDEGTETILVEPLTETRTVNGILCRVVRDRVWLDGDLIEDTRDWYAQDDAGNVWYMGEEVVNYEYDDDGNLLGTDNDGSWEAGVDGASPGIIMWANVAPGASYYQEFYEDEAEDMAIVIATGVTVELEDGTEIENCVRILEWTPLEPDSLEYKYFAPGMGVIVEEKATGEERVEIVLNP